LFDFKKDRLPSKAAVFLINYEFQITFDAWYDVSKIIVFEMEKPDNVPLSKYSPRSSG
jgi:hypothetical protein